MQFSKTSVVSPLAAQPSLLCEQRPADSTTSLGEEPLPFHQSTNQAIKTERQGLAPETTVMAMGYAVGSNDNLSEDIDLSEILGQNDTNLFSASTDHQVNEY